MTTPETLKAKINVITIGTKQLTLSMVRQLDQFPINEERITTFRPIGRIRTGTKITDPNQWGPTAGARTPEIELIGTHTETGELMKLICQGHQIQNELERRWAREQMDKPLIILGGMK